MAPSHHVGSGSGSRLSISRSLARVRVHSPSLQQRNKTSHSIQTDQMIDFLADGEEIDYGTENGVGNKVMVVVDSSLDAKGALHWALSHTVQNQDTIVLIHVAKQAADLRAYDKLNSMKNTCQMRRPGVQVELAMLHGKEKGAVIVEQAKRHSVSLLVLGQRKRSILWRLMKRWTRSKKAASAATGGAIVDYCIQKSSCMTIAVRRKNKRAGGGYLITTKRHKNFWLLA